MKFAYKRFDVVPCPAFPDIKDTLRPIIPVVIEHGGMKIDYEALVDSGADFCIFHNLVGEILGIDIETGKESRFGGMGGSGMHAYFHTVKVRVGDYPYDLYCGFTRDIPADGYGILGQVGFFDHFNILFHYPQEEIEIDPL